MPRDPAKIKAFVSNTINSINIINVFFSMFMCFLEVICIYTTPLPLPALIILAGCAYW